MKKLLTTAAIAGLLVTPALAQGSGQITGIVQPVCEVEDLFGQQAFDAVEAGETIDDGFDITCNDEDGATLRLTAVGGGLRSDDNSDDLIPGDPTTVINYTAEVIVPAVPGFNFALTTTGGDDESEEGTSDEFDAVALASGVSGEVLITLTETALWAGGYSDTIQLDVIAN